MECTLSERGTLTSSLDESRGEAASVAISSFGRSYRNDAVEIEGADLDGPALHMARTMGRVQRLIARAVRHDAGHVLHCSNLLLHLPGFLLVFAILRGGTPQAGSCDQSTMPSKSWKLNELIGGCAAGLTQDVLLHPMDTIRARLDMGAKLKHGQSLPPSGGATSMLLQEARAVIALDGARGLYRGYAWCLATSAPCNALYFGAYRTASRTLGESGPLHDAAAGLIAQVAASTLWTPVDVVKQRLQVGDVRQSTTSAICAARDAASGLSGLWRGFFAGLMVWGPFSSVYFMSYEALRRQFSGPGDAHSGESLACGVSAGALAALATQPLDCAKTRIQARKHATGTLIDSRCTTASPLRHSCVTASSQLRHSCVTAALQLR